MAVTLSKLINPPLVNSANPWATTFDQLKDLYLCPSLGAVTTRTCTLNGFAHDDEIHQYALCDTGSLKPYSFDKSAAGVASLNTFGYSPFTLAETLNNIRRVVQWMETTHFERRSDPHFKRFYDPPIERLSDPLLVRHKPVIVSITGSATEITEGITLIQDFQKTLSIPLLVEINLSCPNILDKPPPAYSYDGLLEYLDALHQFSKIPNGTEDDAFFPLTMGIKTPPYSNPANFATLRAALLQSVEDSPSSKVPISFITATNTLGCSFVPLPSLDGGHLGSADDTGIGGLAGAPLHPLALGNVKMLRAMLRKEESLRSIQIIGVGGVSDEAGMKRMMKAGASIVGIGTALGAQGVGVFDTILGKRPRTTPSLWWNPLLILSVVFLFVLLLLEVRGLPDKGESLYRRM
jgi:dihydroorotate dehydrogenase (fumarate)